VLWSCVLNVLYKALFMSSIIVYISICVYCQALLFNYVLSMYVYCPKGGLCIGYPNVTFITKCHYLNFNPIGMFINDGRMLE